MVWKAENLSFPKDPLLLSVEAILYERIAKTLRILILKSTNLAETIISQNLTSFTKVWFTWTNLHQISKVRDVLDSWNSLLSKTPLTFEFWKSFVWDIYNLASLIFSDQCLVLTKLAAWKDWNLICLALSKTQIFLRLAKFNRTE